MATTVDWFFDVISPFAYLQLEQFDALQEANDIVIRPRPLVLGAILHHWGQKGPAEITSKRVFTYRHALFSRAAARHSVSHAARAPVQPDQGQCG